MTAGQVKELWTVAELAIRLNKSTKTINRWLRANGIPIERVGTENCVWLSELYARKPQLFESEQVARNLAD